MHRCRAAAIRSGTGSRARRPRTRRFGNSTAGEFGLFVADGSGSSATPGRMELTERTATGIGVQSHPGSRRQPQQRPLPTALDWTRGLVSDLISMLRSHDRFPYSPITSRPSFTWPNGKCLAVHVCLNLEHFAYGEGLGVSYSPGLPHPNTYNWGWREYGNRVGVWRLIELFDEFELPVSLLLNTETYDHCPEVVAAFRQRGGRDCWSWTNKFRTPKRLR